MIVYDTNKKQFVTCSGCPGGQGYVEVQDLSGLTSSYFANVSDLRPLTDEDRVRLL